MKTTLLSTLVLFFSASLTGQINKGQWLAGGSAGFETSKHGSDEASKFTSFNFSPNAGYFFMNNFAGGLRLGFNSLKYKDEDASNALLITPFARYYFLPVQQKVNILADAGYGFGSLKSYGESESFNQFTLAAGPAVFLSPNTALELLLQFRSNGGDAYGEDRETNFGFNIGFQVHLGK